MVSVRRRGRGDETGEPGIIVDDRERASGLCEEIASLTGTPPRVRRLEVGDVLIRSRILVERKTATDFEASVLDGRLFEQASALRVQHFDPLLILEGSFSREKNRLSGTALRQALLSLALDWRIPMIRSGSVADTARWIVELFSRRRRASEPPDWRSVAPSGKRLPSSHRTARPRKPARTGPESIQKQTRLILGAVEGIGPVRAEALAKQFGSLAGVLAANHDELARVPGMGSRLAARLRLALEGRTEES